jgi:hypothetical protein
MTFEDALVYMKQGARIYRSSWPSKKEVRVDVAEMGRKTLVFEAPSGSTGVFLVNNQDILAEDWEVVKEKVEL